MWKKEDRVGLGEYSNQLRYRLTYITISNTTTGSEKTLRLIEFLVRFLLIFQLKGVLLFPYIIIIA